MLCEARPNVVEKLKRAGLVRQIGKTNMLSNIQELNEASSSGRLSRLVSVTPEFKPARVKYGYLLPVSSHERLSSSPTPSARPRHSCHRRRPGPVSYTHLRAHETDSYLVCRLLLEKKKQHRRLQKRKTQP